MQKYENFLNEMGLYEKLKISVLDKDDVIEFFKGKCKPEVFCAECKEYRVFNVEKANRITVPKGKNLTYSSFALVEGIDTVQAAAMDRYRKEEKVKEFKGIVESNRITTLKYQCSKDDNHQLVYMILLNESYIMKIGQYPSYRDIESPQMKKFQKVLGEYYPELSTAIRLYSVNVGIGSFVYLRRIIEKLVYVTFKEAELAGRLTEQQFEFQADGQHRNGMEEKIKLLKGLLPDLITDQPKIYGVVSKGIHELSEEECLKYFPILKDGIVMILDDIVAKLEEERNAENYKKSLGNILSELK